MDRDGRSAAMNKFALFLKKNKLYHVYFALMLALTLLFSVFKSSRAVMNGITDITAPVKRVLGLVCSLVPLPVGEILTFAAVLFAVWYILRSIAMILRAEKRFPVLYKRIAAIVCAGLTVYLAFCLMLGANYYSDSFQDKSGVYATGGTVDELYDVTAYFAAKASEAGAKVERDSDGNFCTPLDTLMDESVYVYAGIEEKYPFLISFDLKPKAVLFSKMLSYFGYTGFYYPFTGEANINIDCPLSIIPVTIAHEFSHQRGVAAEDEANFVAIAACLSSGNADYEYSGWLFGYMHLSNALYLKDPQRFAELYHTVSDGVRRDLKSNNDYWDRFETPVSTVSEAVYDEYLKSNGQELGIESYGAVADLLLAYYSNSAVS
jgi:hypothetical protein